MYSRPCGGVEHALHVMCLACVHPRAYAWNGMCKVSIWQGLMGDAQQSNKRIQNLEAANSRKKHRLVSSQQDAASQFLDLEAQQFDSSKEENSDDNSSINGFIDDSTHPRPSLTSSVPSRLIIPNPRPDSHLAVVIARYEARRMREEREGYEMSTGDEEDNEDLEVYVAVCFQAPKG
ncbi:hypothetical protein APHAL10511_003916 [Amanita phalloides]|nr:hypothetical protein APHAL10511_003916 [Amanita phalloides]